MHEAILARQNRHKSPKVHQARDFPFVDTANLDIGSDQFDATTRFLARCAIDRGDSNRAVLLDIDRGTGLLGHCPDYGTTLANNITDFFGVNLEGHYCRRPLGHFFARCADDLTHLTEDV